MEKLGGTVFCTYYNALALRDCVKGRTDRRSATPTRRQDIRGCLFVLNMSTPCVFKGFCSVWYTNWRNRGYLSRESIAKMPIVEDRWRQLAEQLPKWKEQGLDVKKT